MSRRNGDMLAYLLDENISPIIVEQLRSLNIGLRVESVHKWMDGALLGQPDALLLRTAGTEGLTLVTYDLRTIPDLLKEMAIENEAHQGVLFIDDASIRANGFGGLIRALLYHWNAHREEDWINRVAFLSTETML